MSFASGPHLQTHPVRDGTMSSAYSLKKKHYVYPWRHNSVSEAHRHTWSDFSRRRMRWGKVVITDQARLLVGCTAVGKFCRKLILTMEISKENQGNFLPLLSSSLDFAMLRSTSGTKSVSFPGPALSCIEVTLKGYCSGYGRSLLYGYPNNANLL